VINWGDVPTWCAVGLAGVASVVAGWQLRLQRIQLGEQQRVLADQVRQQERQQADQVGVEGCPMDGAEVQVLPADATEPVNMAIVVNGSRRPIRMVSCQLAAESVRNGAAAEVLAQVILDLIVEPVGPGQMKLVKPRIGLRSTKAPVILAGGTVGFAFPFSIAEYPVPHFTTRFTDDAGLHWQINPEMHLEKLASRDDW